MKNKIKRILKVAYFTFWVSVLFTRTAHAYIDPATTSYLFQIVAGIFIAFGATIAVFWKKLKVWLQNLSIRIEETRIKHKAENKNSAFPPNGIVSQQKKHATPFYIKLKSILVSFVKKLKNKKTKKNK